ncbi:hypothetical protein CNX65_27655 [Actinosynnema pretiosum]|uniref:HNH nuclease domain-containing protein n=2 Tax=Actinosynnema pretiosum TaxID=42197 RepID=A0A290ZHH4_9PSEU|nr:hypothetical protein CNX65_27655 [Actinosynnema pretiosum]
MTEAIEKGLAEVCEAVGLPAGDSPWSPGRSEHWRFPGSGSAQGKRVSLSPQFSRTAQNPVQRARIFNTITANHFADIEDRTPLLVAAGLALPEEGDRSGKAAERRASTSNRAVRLREIVKRVKAIHDDQCQFCGLRLQVGPGQYYSEGAHIKALGAAHGGPDTEDNLLCLCPNCHKLFDWFTVYVDEEYNVRHVFEPTSVRKLRRDRRHEINPEYLAYHRSLLPVVDVGDVSTDDATDDEA